MSAQDWLETGDGPVFLESNAQGEWLFLKGARERVPSALAQHLLGRQATGGKWPPAFVRLRYDFMSKNAAPSDDGVIAPQFARPAWIDEVADYRGALALAETARTAAEGGAKTAEDKASRLLQICLALMTLTLALGAYQATFALGRSWPWLFSLLPVAGALAMITLSAFEAQQVDRVGVYEQPTAQNFAGTATRDRNAAQLEVEQRGLELARWTSRNKHTDLMQARAWFSRGLVALILAAALAAGARAATTPHPAPAKPAAPAAHSLR